MKIYTIILILISVNLLLAGGPVLPKGYRALTNEELSLSVREIDEHKFAMVIADFNGDSLIDGAMIAIDSLEKELAIFAFICKEDSDDFYYFKISSSPYNSFFYTGIRKVSPKSVGYYPDAKSETKKLIRLKNDSLEVFNFEGSSSIYYYKKSLNQFNQVWVKK